MKSIVFLFSLCLALYSCTTQKNIFETGKPYERFRGFEPTDPTEYDDKVQIVTENEIINKEIKLLSSEQTLSFLNNETVLVSIGQISFEGGLRYLPVTISMKNTSYKVTMDYMKFATLGVKDSSGDKIIGFRRVGVGLRLISLITTKEAGLNIGDLSSIGLAAKAGKLTGTLMIEVVGIKSKDVTTLLPLPSEINQTTIQNAMQALATIKSKIYDTDTKLYPQIMAVKDEFFFGPNIKNINVQERKVDSIVNDNKLKLQLGNSKADRAKKLENQAFDFLFEKNVSAALQKFEECDKIFPTYNNVYDIGRLLRREKQKLLDKNSTVWIEIYRTILKDFPWKLPQEIIESLEQKVK
jgi:hypothetical protein